MKKILIILLLLLPILSWAQSTSSDTKNIVNNFFEQYETEEGFTSIYITKWMLGMINSKERAAKKDKVKDVIDDLSGIKILTFSSEDSDEIAPQTLQQQFIQQLPKEDYKELMRIKEKKSDIQFMIAEEGNKIRELLMLVQDEEEFVLISLTGLFELNQIADLSDIVNVNGMELLKDIDKK